MINKDWWKVKGLARVVVLLFFFWLGGDFCDFKKRVGLEAENSYPEIYSWKDFIHGGPMNNWYICLYEILSKADRKFPLNSNRILNYLIVSFYCFAAWQMNSVTGRQTERLHIIYKCLSLRLRNDIVVNHLSIKHSINPHVCRNSNSILFVYAAGSCNVSLIYIYFKPTIHIY